MEEGAYSTLTLSAELDRSQMPARDRQLSADLVYGTLRRTIPIDRALAAISTRPLDQVDASALAVLRMGAYQILYTRIPAHAAVSESVAIADQRQRGFINAILRKLARDTPAVPSGNEDADISARTGLTEWAVAELRRVLPAEEVDDAARHLASPAALSLRINECRTTPAAAEQRLRDAGYDVRMAKHQSNVLRLGAGSPTRLPGFDDGWFVIQDEASAVVASAVEARPGERILDACAGPGGKTTALACAVGEQGLVVGADVHPRRAALVRQVGRRLGTPVHVLVQDARRPAVEGPFDAVLVDAPCSGLGAARRRPELLWRPQRESLARLARLQVSILTGVADLVREGGRLIYSVCTFPRAETDAAVRAFLAKRPDFEPLKVPGPGGDAAMHRLWPHRDDTDAMFYAAFRRI